MKADRSFASLLPVSVYILFATSLRLSSYSRFDECWAKSMIVPVGSNIPALVSLNVFFFVEFLPLVKSDESTPDYADRTYAVKLIGIKETLSLYCLRLDSSRSFPMRFNAVTDRVYGPICKSKIRQNIPCFFRRFNFVPESFNARMLFLVGKDIVEN